jgi:hypothetical protein
VKTPFLNVFLMTLGGLPVRFTNLNASLHVINMSMSGPQNIVNVNLALLRAMLLSLVLW